jgi:hypothetical protein
VISSSATPRAPRSASWSTSHSRTRGSSCTAPPSTAAIAT